jgi:hypothetical protein
MYINCKLCKDKMRSLTFWGQEMNIKESAKDFTTKSLDHYSLRAGDKHQRVNSKFCATRDQITYLLRAGKGQQQILQQRDQITYFLRTGDGNQRSAAGFAARRSDHLHPEGRRLPPKGQQQVFQQRDQITYNLREGDGHQRVSNRFCSKESRSLTI